MYIQSIVNKPRLTVTDKLVKNYFNVIQQYTLYVMDQFQINEIMVKNIEDRIQNRLVNIKQLLHLQSASNISENKSSKTRSTKNRLKQGQVSIRNVKFDIKSTKMPHKQNINYSKYQKAFDK